jgi:hypothetical protein
LVRVRVSRLSKGKLEGNWFRRLFSRWTCFSVVTPRKAPSENWGDKVDRNEHPSLNVQPLPVLYCLRRAGPSLDVSTNTLRSCSFQSRVLFEIGGVVSNMQMEK